MERGTPSPWRLISENESEERERADSETRGLLQAQTKSSE